MNQNQHDGKYERLVAGLVQGGKHFLVTILGLMVVMNTLAIALRALFGMSFMWIAPVTLIMFSWLTFLGAAVLFYEKEYIVVDFFVQHFTAPIKRLLAVAINLVMMVFIGVLMYETVSVIIMQTHKMEIVPLPTFIISFPILIGGVTILMVLISQTRKIWKWADS